MTGRRLGDFGDFGGRIWLNTAHQGALPRPAAAEAEEAIAWKMAPSALTQARFDGGPARLRATLGRLLGLPADQIVLANSASYGLHLIANGYPWRDGDEVLVMAGDFPSNILPWLMLERRGKVTVTRIRPRDRVVSPEDLAAAITPRTRLFCASWVHSFSGYALDVAALGSICRERGITFVVNASQALGARAIGVAAAKADALVSVGFKWLCGPYGTGFCWLHPTLRDRLVPQKAYWLAMQTAEDLGRETGDVTLPDDPGVGAFDAFGTANFFNAKPCAAAIEHLLDIGLDRIEAHDQALVSRFIDGLEGSAYDLLSPRDDGQRRSTLVFFAHRDRSRNRDVHASLAAQGIDVAFRAGALRAAPHLYNSVGEIDRVLEALKSETP